MCCSSVAVRVLLAGWWLLACGGVNDPHGEPATPSLPVTGAGEAGQAPGSTAPVLTPASSAAASGADDGGILAGDTLPGNQPSGGAGGQAAVPVATFCDAPAQVFVPSCGTGACHSNPGADIGDFAVTTKRTYSNLVDRVSIRNPDCGRIIDSQDYSKSLLLLKVQEGAFDATRCGGIMPVPSFPQLGASQIDCVASWLQQFQR